MAKRRRSAQVSAPRESAVSLSTSKPTEVVVPGVDPVTRIADGVVEASCLVAVVAVPLYFSLLTQLGPETEKALLLIALAAIAFGAWIVGSFSRYLAGTLNWRGNPVIWAGVSVLAAYGVGTVFSIHPRESFFGSLARHEGFLAHASYTVFFLCAATRLRRPEQIRRLITVIIFASLPAGLYGVLQQLGFDPTPTFGDLSTVQWPVRSSFGNHIFLGAYLVMLIPITAARMFEIWEESPKDGPRRFSAEALSAIVVVVLIGLTYLGFLALGRHAPVLFALFPAVLGGYALLGLGIDSFPGVRVGREGRLAGYGAVLLFQVLSLIFTSARGPWLGVFATLPVVALLVSWRLRRARIAWGILGAAGAIALFVLLLNISGGPLERLRTVHALDRVANVGSYASDSSGAGRLLVWQGVARLIGHHPAVGGTWGGPARDLVGYGPESLDQAFEAVYPLKLRQETAEIYTWDRAHSIYLDILVDAGLLGLLALAATILCFGVRALSSLAQRDSSAQWIAIGVASAVFGHLVEGIFGVETAASLLVFWILLGIAARPSMNDLSVREERPPVRWGAATTGYVGFLVLLVGIFSLLGTLRDHPIAMSTIWILACIVGALVVAWVVIPQNERLQGDRARGRIQRQPGPPRSLALLSAVVCVLVLGSLVVPWREQTAAAAESAGFTHLTSGQVGEGIADLQQAARTAPDEPKYQQDLANVYMGLAQANPQSGEPGYIPSGEDARTLDPERVQTLGRSQLFALAVFSLQNAERVAPLDPTVHGALGDAYLQWKRPLAAYRAYRQAEALSLHNPKYVDGEARALLIAGKQLSALQQAKAALRLDHTFWYSHYTLALIYHASGQKALARTEATLGLLYAPIYQPPPPQNQMDDLRRLQKNG